MGGTFDPIHYGHLVAAEQAYSDLDLNVVVFMPAGRPAFKLDKKVTSGEDRFAMTLLATADNPHFLASRFEIDREGVTYTADTLVRLRELYPENVEFYFITGADAIAEIVTWHDAARIAGVAHLVAATRPGWLTPIAPLTPSRSPASSSTSPTSRSPRSPSRPPTCASASPRGRACATSRPTRSRATSTSTGSTVPLHVIMDRQGMCSPSMCAKKKGAEKPSGACYTPAQLAYIAKVEADVAVQLAAKPKRLAHSISVASTAESMALMYGADPFLARVSGLLHDWDKVVPDDELIERARALELDFEGADYADVKPLLHGCVAARELPERYPELPDEVWHAISVHTTAGLSPDKIPSSSPTARAPAPSSEGTRPSARRARPARRCLLEFLCRRHRLRARGLAPSLRGNNRIYNALAAERAGRTVRSNVHG